MDIIRDCLRAMVEGEFVPDWEFEMVTGIEREQMRMVLEAWPAQTVSDSAFRCAVVGAMNNLVGYPHRMEEALADYVPAGLDPILWTLDRVCAVFWPDEPREPWVPIHQSLEPHDVATVGACLRAVVEGPFFPERGFYTLFNMERLHIEQLLRRWPSASLLDRNVADLICRALINLAKHPHGQEAALPDYVPGGGAALRVTMDRVLAAVGPNWHERRDEVPLPLAELLSAEDMDLIRDCLGAMIEGDFLAEDKFPMHLHMERDRMRELLQAWPEATLCEPGFGNVARAVMDILVNYPHGREKELLRYVLGGREEIRAARFRLNMAVEIALMEGECEQRSDEPEPNDPDTSASS